MRDVVVVGAGPTGSAVAWRLAQAGLDVVCIERGDWFPYEEIARDDPDWELRRARVLHSNPNIRRGHDDVPVDDAESPIKPMIGNAVGGSSIFWSAHVPRFRPEDFRVATLDGVGDDWPIGYDDLEPYYAENEGRLGTAFRCRRPLRSARAATTADASDHRRPWAAHRGRPRRLGWHWWPVDLVVGRDADNPRDATLHSISAPATSGVRAGSARAPTEPICAMPSKPASGC